MTNLQTIQQHANNKKETTLFGNVSGSLRRLGLIQQLAFPYSGDRGAYIRQLV